MGAHGGRRRDGRQGRGRTGARVAVVALAVVAAAALLAGVGAAATPLFGRLPAGFPAGSLLDDLRHDATRDQVAHPDATAVVRDHAAPAPHLPPCVPTVRACVDLHHRRAWLIERGAVVRGPVPIRAGDHEDPTPRGSFTVQWKAQQYFSREYQVPMPYSVFFAPGGIAFHEGNPDTPSAGCVKLDLDDARAFYEYLQVGDVVQVV